jgi:hypothetical protein
MAETNFLKAGASVLAAVLAASLLAATAFAPGAAAQDAGCKGGSSPTAPGYASSR